LIGRGKTKICELHGSALIGNQDILGLEVPMVYPTVMAMLDSIYDLKEDTPNQLIVACVDTLLGNTGKQISLRAIFQNNVDTVRGIQNALQGQNVSMSMAAGLVMQMDLILLILLLLQVHTNLVQGLDSVRSLGDKIPCSVNGAIGADANNFLEFQTIG